MKHYPELRLKVSDTANAGVSGLVLGTNERILTGGFTISDDGLVSGPVADALNRFIDDSVAAQYSDIRTKRDALDAKALAEGMAYMCLPSSRAERTALLQKELIGNQAVSAINAIDPIATHELPLTGELASIYANTRLSVSDEETAHHNNVKDCARDAVATNPFGPISIGIIDASREKARRTGQYTEEQLDAMFGVDAAAAWEAMYSKASAAVAKDERETAHAAAVAEDCAALDVTQISFVDDEQQPQQSVVDDELADAASGAHQHVMVLNVDSMTDATGNSINAAGFKVVLDPDLPPYTVNVKMGDKIVGTCVINPEMSVDHTKDTITLNGLANITDQEAIAAISALGATSYSMAGVSSNDGVTWKKDSAPTIVASILKDEYCLPELAKQWTELMLKDQVHDTAINVTSKIGRSDIDVSNHGLSIDAAMRQHGAATLIGAIDTKGYPGFSVGASVGLDELRQRIAGIANVDDDVIQKIPKASVGLAVPGAGDWSFQNRNVADNFDQHVREQLPWYDLATGIVAHVGRSYLPQNGVMYDIGASTGNVTRCLSHEITSRNIEAISIDNSESMEANWRGLGAFVVADARTHSYRKFHFGVCFLTLMFLPVEDQRTLLDKLVKNIVEGGALLIFDKTEAANGYVGTVMQRLTLAGKMAQGASYEDVVKKELSLSGVQRPINPQALLTRHGAVEIFRFGEFAGWLIVN